MIILDLDPATSTGFAYCRTDKKTCDIFRYGFIDIDTSSKYQGDHCINLMKRLDELYKEQPFDEVSLEDYFFGSRFASGCNANTAFRTAIHIWCCQHNIPYFIYNPSDWKKFISGRSTPTKEQKKKYGKDAAKKIMTQQSLWERFGFRFPNHSLSEKTGKPIMFRYDIVDAIGQLLYHCSIQHEINTFTLSVPVPPDVEFKKINKKIYQYPSV